MWRADLVSRQPATPNTMGSSAEPTPGAMQLAAANMFVILFACVSCALNGGKPLNKPLHRTTLVHRFNEEIQLDIFVAGSQLPPHC